VGGPISSWAIREAEQSCHRESLPHAEGESYHAEYSERGKATYMGKDVTEGRSPHRKRMPDTVGSAHHQPPSLRGRANQARVDTRHRVRDLDRCRDAALLLRCWHDLHTDAARGVDRVTAEVYAEQLPAKREALAQRLQAQRSRAKLVRRWYIPKEYGTERPRGIPAREDNLVQRAGAKLFTAISEQDLLDGR
jgi:hypothetical protein